MIKNKNIIKLISIILLILGITCLMLEKALYGQQLSIADSSLLFPIGILSLLAGLFLSLFLTFRMILKRLFYRQPKEEKQ